MAHALVTNLLALLIQNTTQLVDERRQIVLHDGPQDVQVDSIVTVNEPVSQTNDTTPRYGLPLFSPLRKPEPPPLRQSLPNA